MSIDTTQADEFYKKIEYNPVDIPDWMLDEKGNLATFLDTEKFPTDKGQIHLLVPSGIGDVAWIWAKFSEMAKTRDVKFWFPDDEHKRVAPYADLVGMKYGFTHIDIRELLSFPGEFKPEDFDGGGVFYVHVNRHLETGGQLKNWHPWLPFNNPAPPVFNGPGNDGTAVWRHRGDDPYIVVHMGTQAYAEGNWFPAVWARMIRWIEENIAPVLLVGAKWEETTVEKICLHYKPSLPLCIGKNLAQVLTYIVNSRGMIGIDDGLTIMAAYMGVPALRAYPRWLELMRGKWDDPETKHPHDKYCFMDELIDPIGGNHLYQQWFKTLKADYIEKG